MTKRTSRIVTELHDIEAAAAYRTTVGTFNPRFQTVVMQDMPAREQLGDMTSILIITISSSLRLDQSLVGTVKYSEVRTWLGLCGNGKRIAGAFAKVS